MQRRVTYRLYPTKAQESVLHEWIGLHARLYNICIEQRRYVYGSSGKTLDYRDQQNQLPEFKGAFPEFIPPGSHALQATCKRVALAFEAFFRRLKAGQTPGYPRFKSRDRFRGWTWPDPAGWKLETKKESRKAILHVSNLGAIRARGLPRQAGEPVTCTITRKNGVWEASVVLNIKKAKRSHGNERIAFDWGIEKYLTLSNGESIENPRLLKQGLEALKAAQKEFSDKTKGSKRRAKAKKVVTRLYRDVANKRKDFLHKESAALVARTSFLATEELDTKEMVEAEDAGRGLRRSILDGSPATFVQMVRYKAEEAGTGLKEIDTRKAKPSQRCPECFRECGKKTLLDRTHRCPHCGCVEDRDLAAARVILQWADGRRPPGRGPASIGEERVTAPEKRETPCLAPGASVG